MSFFGFDPSAGQYQNHNPNAARASNEPAYDFQDTYEGLGELEEDDALNDETFGVGNVRKDFNFGSTSQAAAPPTRVNPAVSYACAAANDDEFMQDLWGVNPPLGQAPPPAQPAQPTQPGAGEQKKVLSLQEIEAQLTAIDNSHQQGPIAPPPGQQFFHGGYPPQFPGYMMPQGFVPPPGQYGMPYPGQFMPMQPSMVPQMGQQVPMMVPPQQQPQQPQQPQQAQPPQQAQQPQQPQLQQQQPQLQQQPQQFQQPQQVPVQQPVGQDVTPPAALPIHDDLREAAKSDLSQFPVLGSKGDAIVGGREVVGQPLRLPQNQSSSPHHHGRHHVSLDDLSPEEQEKLARRQEKVARIMRYSGVMNPKDKDFVTRFQLSQIVTDDPYNEDFYAQVYKVIHPQSAAGALGAPPAQQANSIAQAYLDQSGHRLGGRYKRADVALQRMQQQVQKAVTVAKERQKLPQHVREGVLGKISVGSGKKPRQQLTILSKAAQKAKDNEEPEDELVPTQKKRRSPSMAAPSKPIKKYTKKDIMSILEDIINNLMSVESESRSSADVDTTQLWESLHILDQASSSGDDASFVNPFIQCLNYAKALKILPRLFKFLNREQILTIVTLIMSNLENLTVIKDGSYTTYEDKKVPAKILRLVDTYSLTLSKVLMNAVQEFKFNEIIGLLLILVQHNVVSFVSTTKIGLSILTTLLSRAELMRGEGKISATDLSEWTSCYDELFTALESRIAAIFPPRVGDIDEDYVWQFLATLSLGGKLSHQRIIVDEVRDEIFGVMTRAKAIDNSDMANLYKKQSMLNNLNMYLVVMGLVADENEIQELKS